ncbi:MAG: hypothetical protein NT116_00730 [Candidatus Parcubacteria bacterium]|nr:hypothetical protein [Candidatus Parcubacteria bacterium]
MTDIVFNDEQIEFIEENFQIHELIDRSSKTRVIINENIYNGISRQEFSLQNDGDHVCDDDDIDETYFICDACQEDEKIPYDLEEIKKHLIEKHQLND